MRLFFADKEFIHPPNQFLSECLGRGSFDWYPVKSSEKAVLIVFETAKAKEHIISTHKRNRWFDSANRQKQQ